MNAIRITLLSVLAVGLLASGGSAADLSSDQRTQILEEASAAYERGLLKTETDVAAAKDAFAIAADKYELLIDSGIANARLHANLGNARLKEGRLGAAIAAYEHAAVLDPSDRSIRRHLDHVRALRDGEGGSAAADSLSQHFAHWNQLVPSRQRLAVGLIAWIALWGGLTGWLIRRRQCWSTGAAVAGVVAGIVALSLGADWLLASEGEYGIVTSPAVVRAHNGETFEPVVVQPLPEGTRLGVVSRRGDWLQVRLDDGESGWIPSDSCDVIPRSLAQ